MKYTSINKRIAFLVFSIFLFATVIFLSTTVFIQDASSATNNKVTIAVMDFSCGTMITEKGKKVEIETGEITNKLINKLAKTKKFNILERNRLDRIMKELDLSRTGMVNDHKQANNQLLGVDYLIMGSLSAPECEVTYEPIPYVEGRYTQTISGTLSADMRVVETETGKIIQAETGRVNVQGKKMTRSADDKHVPDKFIEDLKIKLVDQLVQYVVDACYPIKVIRFANDIVYLNRGKDGGLSVGLHLGAYKEGEPLVDPDTGVVLGTDEIKIAVLEVTQIAEKFAKARVLSWENNSRDLRAGTICRNLVTPPLKRQTPVGQEKPKRARLPE